MADLRGRRGRAPPPLGVQILSISCSFWEILAKSYVGAPPGELAPPARGNPGSATELIVFYRSSQAGDRVFTVRTTSGAYAQYATSKEVTTFHLHPRMTFEQGASIGQPYACAYRALFKK